MELAGKRRMLPWLNALATALVLVINILANSLPLNGVTTGEISDRYPAYFVPAGYVFSIWGLIYIGLIAFSVYQLLPIAHAREDSARIGYHYVVASLANVVWLVLWHYGPLALTPLPMIVLLVSLGQIYVRLGIGKRTTSQTQRWLAHVPFSVYLGWITVATVANMASVLYALNWGGWGFGGQVWAFLLMLVAAALAITFCLKHHDMAYTLVIAWALLGISVKQGGSTLVSPAALVLAILLVVLAFVSLLGPLETIISPKQ